MSVRRNHNICEAAVKVLIPLKSPKFLYFFSGNVFSFFADVWERRLFEVDVYILNSRGGRGGGADSKFGGRRLFENDFD